MPFREKKELKRKKGKEKEIGRFRNSRRRSINAELYMHYQ